MSFAIVIDATQDELDEMKEVFLIMASDVGLDPRGVDARLLIGSDDLRIRFNLPEDCTLEQFEILKERAHRLCWIYQPRLSCQRSRRSNRRVPRSDGYS